MNLLILLFIASAVNAFVPSNFGMRHQVRRYVAGKDYFDMHELQERINKESRPYTELFKTTEWEHRAKPAEVNIILFKPDTDEEGVHTIEYPKGSGNNVILAFECMSECGSFAAMLKKQNFYDPSPQPVDLESLESYCDELGVSVQVVPRGMDLVPPTQNVVELGHNADLKNEKSQLNYIFGMSDAELEEVGALEVEEIGGAWE